MDKRVSHCSELHFRALGRFCGTTYVLVALLLGLFPLSASAASFDCKKAKTSFEKRVCSNPELSRLDEEMATAYKVVMSKTEDIDGLKKTQRRWWAAFQRSSPAVAVLAAAYRSRIYYLQGETSGQLNAIARERAFAARAVREKLNCRAEPTVVQRTPSEWPWLLGRNKIYLECLTGLLFAKQFDQVKQQIQVLDGDPQIWGTDFLPILGMLPNLMVHGMDDAYGALIIFECKLEEEEEAYHGSELHEILSFLLARIDLNADDPIEKKGGEFRHLRRFTFVVQRTECLDPAFKASVFHLLLDFGLKTTYWHELKGAFAGPEITDERSVSALMAMGDKELVRRILKGGITTNGDPAVMLALHAPNMEMVRLAEESGFRMNKEQATEALRQIKKQADIADFEDAARERGNPPVDLDPGNLHYIQELAE